MLTQKPSFRFEIDNFSRKEAAIKSQTFLSGGCEWYLYVEAKGNRLAINHLSLCLYVANRKSLRTGWKRSAGFYFVVLDQSDKELYRTPVAQAANNLFCDKFPGRVFLETLPLSKLQEKGFLENDKLIIEVYINVAEAVDGEGEEDVSHKKGTVKINGFQVLASQVNRMWELFEEHPDVAKDFKPKNKVVKTEYMNVLLNLIETLHKPIENLSKTELSKARSELRELMKQGFKLDWLRSKLKKASLKRKKADNSDRSWVQQIEERFKNLELVELGSLKSKIEEVSLEMKKIEDDRVRFKNHEWMDLRNVKAKLDEVSLQRKKAQEDDRSRFQQLEEPIKNLELMGTGKLDFLKTELAELSLEMKKANADGSLVQKLEERVKHLEVMELGWKFEEDSLERNQSYDADGSRVKQLEESVKNLELMVSNVKVELDKKKDKSCDDGFLLVDEVD